MVSDRPPDTLLRAYLEEVLGLVESTADFAVLAHIDYALRSWPAEGPPFVVADFEEEFRTVLRALAGSGRALEADTKSRCRARWCVGGSSWAAKRSRSAATPTSRPCRPRFATAAAMVESRGFRPGPTPHDFWRR